MVERLRQLTRLRFTGASIGTLIGIIVMLYLMTYLVQTIKRNYELQDQINVLSQQNANLQVEQDSLRYRIQYYQTDEYKEKEARSRLGLQQPGEGVILLPRDNSSITQVQQNRESPKRSNWQHWIDFLSGKH